MKAEQEAGRKKKRKRVRFECPFVKSEGSSQESPKDNDNALAIVLFTGNSTRHTSDAPLFVVDRVSDSPKFSFNESLQDPTPSVEAPETSNQFPPIQQYLPLPSNEPLPQQEIEEKNCANDVVGNTTAIEIPTESAPSINVICEATVPLATVKEPATSHADHEQELAALKAKIVELEKLHAAELEVRGRYLCYY